jgi:divergent 4Fe-4S mono-cluster protein
MRLKHRLPGGRCRDRFGAGVAGSRPQTLRVILSRPREKDRREVNVPAEAAMQEYRNDKIAVSYDPKICIHAGDCVRGLPGGVQRREKALGQCRRRLTRGDRRTDQEVPVGRTVFPVSEAGWLDDAARA